jgi:hypothetical protein
MEADIVLSESQADGHLLVLASALHRSGTFSQVCESDGATRAVCRTLGIRRRHPVTVTPLLGHMLAWAPGQPQAERRWDRSIFDHREAAAGVSWLPRTVCMIMFWGSIFIDQAGPP